MKPVTLVCWAFAIILFLSTGALAQETVSASRVEIFGGFSHMNFKPGSSITTLPGQNFNGAEGSITWNFLPQVGAVVDFSGYHAGNFGTLGSASAASFLFGPQVSLRSKRADPFIHTLFGALRIGGITNTNFPQTGFAMALGGGLDLKANDYLAIRIAQADYLFSRMAIAGMQPTILGPATKTDQHSFRFSVGIVLRLGTTLPTLPSF
jgi:hypothetical protein